MKFGFLCALAASLFCLTTARAEPLQQPALAVGQVWSVKADPSKSIKVVIGRIEPWEKGLIAVSVAITNIPNDKGPTSIGHAPFEKATLMGSLDRLLATNAPAPSGFDEGYEQWKAARGGIFTISVTDAIADVLGILGESAPHQAGGS